MLNYFQQQQHLQYHRMSVFYYQPVLQSYNQSRFPSQTENDWQNLSTEERVRLRKGGSLGAASQQGQDISTIIGPEIDALRRFRTIGWYYMGGFARLREAALYRIESASSIN